MSLLSYNRLCQLVEEGVIEGSDVKYVNGTSIDVHMGPEILVERGLGIGLSPGDFIVSLRDKEQLNMNTLKLFDNGMKYLLAPGEFILAHTIEKFNLPATISAEFKLNSSGARIGLENALATWCFVKGTMVATLDGKETFSRFHTIRLDVGCRIGQMIFHESDPVPVEKGYAVRGRYNKDTSVSSVKKA